uniref:LAGLIDADG endonuclease n=1 Tax=Fusarium asiaticum TaxID=282267 RepID=A0A6M5C073_FUSAS|nr:LAGLIDADG endonuclease [Fusarium asiaticum]QJT66911.1 LAGLIDADG endonuclease [Fusarium asiaticum]
MTTLIVNKSSTTLVRFINFLNGRPILKNVLKHLYTLRNKYNCYNQISKTSPIDTPLKNKSLTYLFNKRFSGMRCCFAAPFGKINYSISYSTTVASTLNGHSLTDTCDIKMKNFYEWFSGFTDAEGSFYIAISKNCSFRFQINLHKDDLNVLYYIHQSLGFGEVRSYNNYASFTVTRLKDIAQLINIFDKFPLQGSKWLNYRDFVLAFQLYTNSNNSSDVLKEIAKLKNNMNRLRLDYTISKDKVINITSYWLLGFIEGEGCFSINRHNNYRLDFSLSQSSIDLELMKSIKVYLENLTGAEGNYTNALGISEVRSNNPNHKSTTRIETARIPFITNILIPFLDSLTWQSKKYLDFQDWKNILKLKEQGHHLSEKGSKLIDLIISQTNNNRLSTSLNHVIVDREQILAKVNELLDGPANFEIRNSRKFVVSLNKYYHSSRKNVYVIIVDEKGNKLHVFDSLADCAKFLNVDPSTVSKRKSKEIPFIFENKTVYIKNEKASEDGASS